MSRNRFAVCEKTTTGSLGSNPWVGRFLDRFVWCSHRKRTTSHMETFCYVLDQFSNNQQEREIEVGVNSITTGHKYSPPSYQKPIVDFDRWPPHRTARITFDSWSIFDSYSQHGSVLTYFLPKSFATSCLKLSSFPANIRLCRCHLEAMGRFVTGSRP